VIRKLEEIKDMKRLVAIAALIGLIAVAIACRDDVFVEPPPSLTGDYTGVYIYKIGGQTPTEQRITWRFSSNGYSMYWDEQNPGPDSTRYFCDCSGEYELGDGVNLIEIVPVVGVITCDTSLNPKGPFQLDQSTDTVKLTQYDANDDVLKTVKLLPE
jgi:hypothetical protein